MGDGGGINVEENLNRLDEPACVLTSHGTLVDVFTSEPADPSMDLLGDVPTGHVGTTKYNIKLKWIKTRLQQMPLDVPDDVLIQYARCYILYLLEGACYCRTRPTTQSTFVTYLCKAILMPSALIVGVAHVFVGYIESCAWQQITPSKIYYGLSFWALDVATPHSFPLATSIQLICTYSFSIRWAGKKEYNDYAEQRLLRHRLRLDNLQVDEFNWLPYIDPRILLRVPAEFLGHSHGNFYTLVIPLILFWWIEFLNIDKVLRQFGGKQGPRQPSLEYRYIPSTVGPKR
ncbi:hypothetical protein Ahy_A08g039137 [Arachis hypogaea]|uniref:Aminotransferase-like plant mobile domain-containing protein n=1 Tax=Arachis hypogaea TaxID=3818 RepID=A0A445BVD4_ARAHY|nr:hypothetical protein Ahy_A08g039137 [Arachis hypogaea]